MRLYSFQKPPHNKFLRCDLCPFNSVGVGGLGLDGDFGAVGQDALYIIALFGGCADVHAAFGGDGRLRYLGVGLLRRICSFRRGRRCVGGGRFGFGFGFRFRRRCFLPAFAAGFFSAMISSNPYRDFGGSTAPALPFTQVALKP